MMIVALVTVNILTPGNDCGNDLLKLSTNLNLQQTSETVRRCIGNSTTNSNRQTSIFN